MVAPQFQSRQSFSVPATAGQYAPEEITFAATTTDAPSPGLLGVTALIETLPTAAAVELWLLRGNGDPTNAGHWVLYKSVTASDTFPLASYRGAKLRVKSGGTAGSATLSATAD